MSTEEDAADSRPKRIQLRRTKGWRKPAGVIVVSRPGPWGNPFPIRGVMNRESAVAAFRDWVGREVVPEWAWRDRHELMSAGLAAGVLTGKSLACWCALDLPCHADVLLEIANPVGGVVERVSNPPGAPVPTLTGDHK